MGYLDQGPDCRRNDCARAIMFHRTRIKYGFPAAIATLLYALRHHMAQSVLAGGNVRPGLEDAVYLAKGNWLHQMPRW